MSHQRRRPFAVRSYERSSPIAPKIHPADQEASRLLNLEEQLSRTARRLPLLLLTLLCIPLITLGLLLCLLPKQEFSPKENRLLTTAPTFSVASLLDGTLTADVSRMCADQFPLRSQFIRAKAALELLLSKGQNNSVILGHDGYLITRPNTTKDQLSAAQKNLASVARFSRALAQRKIPFVFAPVPRSIDVNQDKLPRLFDAADAARDVQKIREDATALGLTLHDLITPLRTAAEQGKAVWYRTDHHWTTLGAYVAYLSLADSLGYEPYPLAAFEPDVVCTDFLGTTQAKSGMSWVDGDHITLFRYEGDDRLQTEILDNGQVTRHLDGLYDLSALDTHDKYSVFLGGTNTHIRVSAPQASEAKTLLVIKDSFSQSLAPFLARHFHLILIDPRTYSTQNEAILSLAEREKAVAVLLLYGVDTLLEGHSLRVLEYGIP